VREGGGGSGWGLFLRGKTCLTVRVNDGVGRLDPTTPEAEDDRKLSSGEHHPIFKLRFERFETNPFLHTLLNWNFHHYLLGWP
jgi:hypothetical protein